MLHPAHHLLPLVSNGLSCLGLEGDALGGTRTGGLPYAGIHAACVARVCCRPDPPAELEPVIIGASLGSLLALAAGGSQCVS